jgi:TonB family protein
MSSFQFLGGLVKMLQFGISPRRWRRLGVRLFQVAALGLLATVAMPVQAADDRAVKTRVAPVYPEIAKRMRISGTVRVEATVDPDGKVIDVKTLSGSRALSPAAEDAVRKWRFAPGAAQATIDVEINFAL